LCEHSSLGNVAYAGTLLGQGLVLRALLRRGRSPLVAGIAASAALLPAVVLAGALVWLPTDYPHFLGENARSRLGLPAGPIRCVAGNQGSCCQGPVAAGGR